MSEWMDLHSKSQWHLWLSKKGMNEQAMRRGISSSIVLQKRENLIDFYWLLMQNSTEWNINYVNYDFTSLCSHDLYQGASHNAAKLIQEHSLMVNRGQKQNAVSPRNMKLNANWCLWTKYKKFSQIVRGIYDFFSARIWTIILLSTLIMLTAINLSRKKTVRCLGFNVSDAKLSFSSCLLTKLFPRLTLINFPGPQPKLIV